MTDPRGSTPSGSGQKCDMGSHFGPTGAFLGVTLWAGTGCGAQWPWAAAPLCESPEWPGTACPVRLFLGVVLAPAARSCGGRPSAGCP
eukprot:3228061-Rhodomonas_salina.1